MANFVSPNAVMIEVLINASSGQTATQTSFLEQQLLLNRPIVAIEAFCDQDFPNSPLSAGVPVIPVALFNKAFIQINRTGNAASRGEAGLYFKNLPLCMLRRVQNNYTGLNPSVSFAREIFRVKPMFVQWPDSQVCFPTPATQSVPVYSVPFLIHFLLPGEDPTKYTM